MHWQEPRCKWARTALAHTLACRAAGCVSGSVTGTQEALEAEWRRELTAASEIDPDRAAFYASLLAGGIERGR